MPHNFHGTGVAIVTPFNQKKEVDYTALGKLVEFITTGGVEFIVVMGTTGESVTLNQHERQAVLEKITEVNRGKLPIVLGIGGNNTNAVINQLEETDMIGLDGILSVSPYYNKPTQEGIYQHYKAISEASMKPVILYNVPARTGSNVLPETVLRIANDCENIVAVKEASGDINQSMEIIKNKPKGFQVFSGDDNLTLPLMACGADGVISVVANAFPREFSNLVREASTNNFETARNLHYRLMDIINYLFIEGNPAGVKAALKIQGITGDDLRLPLVNVSDTTYKKLDELIRAL